MADYKELIRKAIQALPENNGAARRAVYEKARAALVGQLRGLNPPLAARDITQHRLQLEDCIRQVEQEASEAVIAGLKQNEELAAPPQQQALPPPRPISSGNGARPLNGAQRPSAAPRSPAAAARTGTSAATARAIPSPATRQAGLARPVAPQAPPRVAAVQPKAVTAVAAARPATVARAVPRSQAATFPRVVADPEVESEDEPETIEDIIAAAEQDVAPADELETAEETEIEAAPEPPPFKLEPRRAAKPALAAPTPAPAPARQEARPLPAIVARAEAAKAGRSSARTAEPAKRANGGEPIRRANGAAEHIEVPASKAVATANQPADVIKPRRNGSAAMSSVREVDLEAPTEGDPQVTIERAIATLEREARNDDDGFNGDEAPNSRSSDSGRRRLTADKPARDGAANGDVGFNRGVAEPERGGGSAVTIFLLVFLVLLVAAGGGGFWAWREGFIDFDAMFGKATQVATQTAAPASRPIGTQAAASSPAKPATPVQTNTEPAPNAPAQSAEQMSAAPADATADAPVAAAEPSAQTGGPKSEERLTQSADTAAAAAPDAAGAPADNGTAAAPAGSQSLLLEASQDGTTGAVPFSGTVEWSKGTDEMGQPTLVGKASIPARNLGVSLLIRKNSDPTLPASHLMEINFSVSDSFIGGSISGLPGVLLKNEELVQGTPLVGASARVVGNSFLFALSSSPADETTNKDLLTSRKWIDLAIIYATGKKAIITLEKDDKAEAMFNDVFTAWSKEAAADPAAAAPAVAAGK